MQGLWGGNVECRGAAGAVGAPWMKVGGWGSRDLRGGEGMQGPWEPPGHMWGGVWVVCGVGRGCRGCGSPLDTDMGWVWGSWGHSVGYGGKFHHATVPLGPPYIPPKPPLVHRTPLGPPASPKTPPPVHRTPLGPHGTPLGPPSIPQHPPLVHKTPLGPPTSPGTPYCPRDPPGTPYIPPNPPWAMGKPWDPPPSPKTPHGP